MSRFFYSTLCLWALFLLLRIVLVCLFSLLCHIPVHEHTTTNLSISTVARHSSGLQLVAIMNEVVLFLCAVNDFWTSVHILAVFVSGSGILGYKACTWSASVEVKVLFLKSVVMANTLWGSWCYWAKLGSACLHTVKPVYWLWVVMKWSEVKVTQSCPTLWPHPWTI